MNGVGGVGSSKYKIYVYIKKGFDICVYRGLRGCFF